jgi:hypothetical protein
MRAAMTYRLSDNDLKIILHELFKSPPFREHQPQSNFSYIHKKKLLSITFVTNDTVEIGLQTGGIKGQSIETDQPKLQVTLSKFIPPSCESLLVLHSFYNYFGDHCHDAAPWKLMGLLMFPVEVSLTREVVES